MNLTRSYLRISLLNCAIFKSLSIFTPDYKSPNTFLEKGELITPILCLPEIFVTLSPSLLSLLKDTYYHKDHLKIETRKMHKLYKKYKSG